MDKKIKLIITDLDRTFLRTDKSISNYSLDIIKRCKEQGIYIAIATARSEQAAANYIDYSKPLNYMTYKITVEVLENRIAEKIASIYPECSFLIFVGENWCRFAHRDATKINAINEIAKYLNISLEEVAAFGDDINDIGMIKHCGQGIAVSNAIKEILECASHITGSNDEDGVAAFISENFL
ncbi:HAD hydrolase family protein [Clostridium sp.]|uniref:HAD family hydrolase n=1 Tax=Clostridium sp. TaxID=1506 RepID=UPI003216E9FE